MEKSVSGALNVLFCTQPESTPAIGEPRVRASIYLISAGKRAVVI